MVRWGFFVRPGTMRYPAAGAAVKPRGPVGPVLSNPIEGHFLNAAESFVSSSIDADGTV